MRKPESKPKPRRLRIDRARIRKLAPTTNPFLSLARSIVYQQISTKAGDSIYSRFLLLFKGKKPTPQRLLSLPDHRLREAGLSGQKIRYMRDLAERFLDGTIEPKNFPKMSDEEVVEHLTAVKGVGRWTAEMFLIGALNRPNILPLGDLGVKKGFQKAFDLKRLPSERQMLMLAKAHEGEWTELTLHLWYILEGK